MITSKRTFGVEIEIDARETALSDLADMIEPDFRLVSDSSIIGQNPIEVVSTILRGKNGENSILEVCDTLRECEVDTTGINSGFHVHIGASDFTDNDLLVLLEREEAEVAGGAYFASFAAIRHFLNLDISDKLNNEHYSRFFRRYQHCKDLEVLSMSRFDDFLCTFKRGNIQYFVVIDRDKYIKIEKMDNRDKINEFLYGIYLAKPRGKYAKIEEDNKVVTKLKNLLLTYVVFNDVVSGMVPNSRKENNSYCRKVSDTYTVDEILAVKTANDFKKLWYLTDNMSEVQENMREHYNASRYQDVNLHSIWNRTNTVEIRSHKSTIEPKLIINWIKFHQLIVDSVASGLLNQENILPATKLDLPAKVLYFLDLLNADDVTRTYVKTLINHYNFLKL